MSIYHEFARVYDRFMSDTPVDEWVAFIEQLWNSKKMNPELILDIGCGTGAITVPLAQKGYNIIGIDISEDMLSAARQKAECLSLDILFLNQDMRAFELYGTVDCVISVCDTVNYLNNNEELSRFFGLVYNYLNAGGLFIFDISTEYKYSEILADSSFCDISDNAAYIWENNFDSETHINEYLVTFFIENETGKYERFEELHCLRAFSAEEITRALEASGFSDIKTFDANGFGTPVYESERIFFSALRRLPALL